VDVGSIKTEGIEEVAGRGTSVIAAKLTVIARCFRAIAESRRQYHSIRTGLEKGRRD
jgi:hypothetical protein